MNEKELTRQSVEVLKNAAKLLEEKGWIQGRLGNEKEGYCLVGALVVCQNKMPGTEDDKSSRYMIINRVLYNITGDGIIALWNDEGKRTKKEVINLLGEAATKLEAING